ncbi:hypothetical protein FRC03_001820 [Tulasnella sp. 419]|nr:hypothetical protein FRC03_001820 [Tulasnella sp. 419]
MSPAGLDGSTIAPTSPPASTVTPLPLQEEDVQRIAQALMDRSAQVHGQVAGPPPAYG